MNNNKQEETNKIIGICPICKKGEIIDGRYAYMCNFFKTVEEQCQFTIYKSYFEKEITEDIARDLIEKGKTDVFNNLKRKDGKCFSATLILDGKYIKPHFENRILEHKCPICKNNIEELAGGFACINYLQDAEDDYSKKCGFFIPKKIAQYTLRNNDINDLIINGKTEFIENEFINKKGNTFSAILIINEYGRIEFSNTICECPKCGGDIYNSNKAYNCNNWKNENIKCDFVIWKQIAGRDINYREVKTLCKNKETDVLNGFFSKDQKKSAKLVINEEYKVIIKYIE